MQLSKCRIFYSPKLTHSRINLLTNISSRGSATCLHITYARVQTFICFFPLPANICGVCLVSEKDIENLKQTMPGCSNSSITPYEVVVSLHDHFDDSAMAKNDTELSEDMMTMMGLNIVEKVTLMMFHTQRQLKG